MLLTHLLALLVVYWIEVSIWIKLLITLIVLVSLLDVFRRYVLRIASNAITVIELDSDGNMKLGYRNGAQTRVSRLRSIFVSPVVTLVTATAENNRFAQKIVIPFDAVESDLFRILRVKLKQGKIN